MDNIREYYTKTFPTDELGEELSETATFQGLARVLCTYQDIYDYIGVVDSLVRERLFEKVSAIYSVSYDDVYKTWAKSFEV